LEKKKNCTRDVPMTMTKKKAAFTVM